MSTNLDTAHTAHSDVEDVHVTDFAGNDELGQMVQLHTGFGTDASIIKMTEGQVDSILITLTEWKKAQHIARMTQPLTVKPT